MVKRTDCTISDICINYLVKNSFNLFIERTNGESVNEWYWIAERTDLHLYATDPVRLIALYMIHKDWINKRKRCKTEEADGDYVSVNDKFGYFKFLGAYPTKKAEEIVDYGNTYKYAVDKLVQWGYMVSIVDDSVDFSENCNLYIAEKNKKIYSATDPLRLLGLVSMIQEYGEDWAYSDVVKSFTIQPAAE